jgi:hypothetical protein
MWTMRFSPRDKGNGEPIQKSEAEEKCGGNSDAERSHCQKCEEIYYELAHRPE